MDNKPLENHAEDYIKVILNHANIKFLKPNYDENGSDLVLLHPINKHLAKQVVVQSKGRNVTSNSSNVTIPIDYVVSNFICFIYLKVEGDFDNHCYIFFHDSIKNWNLNKDHYTLSIPKKFKDSDYLKKHIFDPKTHVPKINDMLRQAPILRQSYIHFESMELKEVLFEMWKKHNSLPDITLVKSLYDDFSNLTGSHALDIFIICMIAKYLEEMKYRTLDSFMQDLYEIRNIDKPISQSLIIHDIEKINRQDAVWAVVYPIVKFGQVNVTYDGVDYKGLYCHIGDKEDHVEVLLFDNGDYVCFGQRSNV
ncbi:hypothetical protein L580_1935 [Serratia fonticola AU-P3(3)]|nr:hypothetical protein L580_1935 [Serratia fonticola AU-P3(3)]